MAPIRRYVELELGSITFNALFSQGIAFNAACRTIKALLGDIIKKVTLCLQALHTSVESFALNTSYRRHTELTLCRIVGISKVLLCIVAGLSLIHI